MWFLPDFSPVFGFAVHCMLFCYPETGIKRVEIGQRPQYPELIGRMGVGRDPGTYDFRAVHDTPGLGKPKEKTLIRRKSVDLLITPALSV